ncbi:MAG: T9SS type B sorting domain-containing protein, partial [Bacteroidota bacterium]
TAGYPNCVSSDTIEVIPCQELVVPNVFTPNGDGKNDVFLIIGKTFETYDLKIFNRWGKLLFETHSAYEGWNGEVNKNPCPASTYYYTLEYTDKFYPSEVKRINGSVTLLR